MGQDSVSKLTSRQRACLRLVLRHMQSKEIGRELGISPMTVDNHLRSAIQTLGVSTRIEAARLMEAHDSSQRLTSQPDAVAGGPESFIMASPDTTGDGQRDMVSAFREDQVPYQTLSDTSFPDLRWPVPTKGRPRNDLSIVQRLFWIAILIAAMGLGAGALLSSFATMSNIFLAFKR